MIRGWFNVPGEIVGDRSLEEQMLGVAPALAEAKGKRVIDLGCAEGFISLEFARAGAAFVYGCDYNRTMNECAVAALAKAGPLPVKFEYARIERQIVEPARPQFDIVLALAVLHKLPDPAAGVNYCADCARSLIVIRLPHGSTGFIRSKHNRKMDADIPQILTARGFTLEQTLPGPRGELVQYYRRLVSASATS